MRGGVVCPFLLWVGGAFLRRAPRPAFSLAPALAGVPCRWSCGGAPAPSGAVVVSAGLGSVWLSGCCRCRSAFRLSLALCLVLCAAFCVVFFLLCGVFFVFFLASCFLFSYLCCWFSVRCLGFLGFFFGWCPVPLGCVRGPCVRVVSRVRLVRAGGLACPGVGGCFSRGSCGRCLPALRFLAVRPFWVLLVGGVVGGRGLRCLSRRVSRLWRRPGAWRPAPLVFLVFFNICPRCCPLGGIFFLGFSACNDAEKTL